MKIRISLLLLSLLSAQAFATKPCDELKSEIDAKIKANGVKSYTLDVVDNSETDGKTVVGSCNNGLQKIIYARN